MNAIEEQSILGKKTYELEKKQNEKLRCFPTKATEREDFFFCLVCNKETTNALTASAVHVIILYIPSVVIH